MGNGEILMSYDDFKSELRDKLLNELEKRVGMPLECRRHDIDKVNDKYESLTITPEGSRVGVNARIDKAYEAYRDGNSMDEVIAKVADAIEKAFYNMPDVNRLIPDLEKYENVKDRLVLEVVSAEANAKILESVPHKNMEDMAVIYRIDAREYAGDGATIVVTNTMFEKYGITLDQLHEDALQSAPKLRPMVIEGMGAMLAKTMGVDDLEMLGMDVIPEDEKLFVATVDGNVHGAGVLAYQDFMDKAAEKIGGDFFILPSSLHELILVPDNGEFDTKSLKQMVRDVNAGQVEPEDKLTDNVYHYDTKDKVFELGEKFKERQAARAEPEKKKSVLEELKAVKEEIASQKTKEVIEKGTKALDSLAI